MNPNIAGHLDIFCIKSTQMVQKDSQNAALAEHWNSVDPAQTRQSIGPIWIKFGCIEQMMKESMQMYRAYMES